MREHDARRASLVLVGVLVACAGGAEPGPAATSARPTSTHVPSEPAGSPGSAEPERTPEAPGVDEPAPGPSAEPSPTIYTRVSFDLRGMPHRAPYDVDGRLVSGRVERLMQQVRDAAREPAPRLLVYPGASVFRAEFFGPEPQALSQCQRAVAALAPAEAAPGARAPHAAPRAVRATPCARIEGAHAL